VQLVVVTTVRVLELDVVGVEEEVERESVESKCTHSHPYSLASSYPNHHSASLSSAESLLERPCSFVRKPYTATMLIANTSFG
jgi:hypothetical protein